MKTRYFAVHAALLAAVAGTLGAADFNPVVLTPESFNADIIVEKTAPAPLPAGSTATMDGGLGNTGNTWYAQGFNVLAPLTGLPAAGTLLEHASDGSKSYSMPPTYVGNNAVFISSDSTTGTVTLETPTTVSGLSFLSSSGGGACVINYTVTHADNSTETGSFTSGDWFNGALPAHTANGRVQVDSTTTFNNVDAGNPRLYSQEIVVSAASPVASIALTFVSGGRCSIFALAGETEPATWLPLSITGFNRDLVLDPSEAVPDPLTTVTTVSMDGGTANTGNTWYERGYYPNRPTSGLPEAGSVITSTALTDHHYQMAADYTANNAIYIDQANPTATITFATPFNYSALSFLNATANGAVTVQCTMHYEDNTTETQQFVAKDWFNGTPFAYNASGRVHLQNRSMNNYNNGVNPRLYEAEFVLNNTVSKITSVDLTFLSGGANGRVAILAVSATAGTLKPIYTVHPLSKNVTEGDSAQFTAEFANNAQPTSFRWQKQIAGVFTDLSDTGNVFGTGTGTLNVDSATLSDAGVYRLCATNEAGTTYSEPALFGIISSLQDVTSPFDSISAFGGTSPGAEGVEFTIDGTTQKYLNFGSGPNNQGTPFVGPVGLVVTPSAGPTVLTGLRFYTANDAVERDPADYTLEGSVDGGNSFGPIASGSLILPATRNAAGLSLDPLAQAVVEVLFENTAAYTTYRLTFNSVKTPASANSMQIGEVEFLGTVADQPEPALTIVRNIDGSITITPNRAGTLQSSTTLSGPPPVWFDVATVDPSTPFTFNIDPFEPQKFFRLFIP